MCEKVAYGNKQKANFAMRRILTEGKRMRVYRCDRCFKFHLTSDLRVIKLKR